MTESRKKAGEELVGICMAGVRNANPRDALAMTYTQAVLTQETFQALYDTLKAAGFVNLTAYEANLEKAFRARIAGMTDGGLILPASAATPKVNGSS